MLPPRARFHLFNAQFGGGKRCFGVEEGEDFGGGFEGGGGAGEGCFGGDGGGVFEENHFESGSVGLGLGVVMLGVGGCNVRGLWL